MRLYGQLLAAWVRRARATRIQHWPVVGAVIREAGNRFLRIAHPPQLTVDGHTYRLDANDDLGLVKGGGHEPLLQDAMSTYIPRGGVVVEGGAHIGFHTLQAARLVGAGGTVYAFEPARSTFDLLTGNVQCNGYENVIPVRGALSDVSRHGELHVSPVNSGDNRISPAAEGRATVGIAVHSLDDYLPASVSVAFLKLDVQGVEWLVLEGMKQVLARSPGLVAVLEYAPFVMPSDADPADVTNAIFDRFAMIYDLDEHAGQKRATTRDELLAKYTRANEHFTNLLCLTNGH